MKNKIQTLIEPRERHIGISVKRILPWAKKLMVGPFVFLDEMGPTLLHPPKDHVDVRPHPHIGLSTLTYLFEGNLLHRDSIGSVQEILPGEVNWMTAGKGISHSEREPEAIRDKKRHLHGLQFWVALPKEKEDMEPSFYHYDIPEIPSIEKEGAVIDIVAGSFEGKTSPLITHSPMLFLVVRGNKTGTFSVAANGFELALYVVRGEVHVDQEKVQMGKMLVLEPGSDLDFRFSPDALVAIIGGETFPETRYIWWNFVSSSKEKIESAKKAWELGTFPQVPGDLEKIPLPKD